MICNTYPVPLLSAFSLNSSPSTAGTPITPTSDTTEPVELDLYHLIDPRLIEMSPTRGALHHSASYTYGTPVEGQYPGGMSQERSTVSPAHGSAYHFQAHQQWHNRYLPAVAASSQGYASNMLPPLHPTHQGTRYWNYQLQHAAFTQQHPEYTYQHYPTYAQRAPSFTHHTHGQQHSASSNSSDSLYTPSTNGQVPLQLPSTVTPSAFQGWEPPDHETRGQNVSGGLLRDEQPLTRPLNRRLSSPFPVNGEDNQGDTSMMSPSSVSEQYSDDGYEELQPVGLEYTTDCETKQTPELRRKCYNCEDKEPPSWRKSVLNVGHILCNKCGIYERAHAKPRPFVPYDGKIPRSHAMFRKLTQGTLRVKSEESDTSPLRSKFVVQPQPTVASHPFFDTIKTNPNQPLLSSNALAPRHHARTPAISHNPYAHAYAQRRAVSYNSAPNGYALRRPALPTDVATEWNTARRDSNEPFDSGP